MLLNLCWYLEDLRKQNASQHFQLHYFLISISSFCSADEQNRSVWHNTAAQLLIWKVVGFFLIILEMFIEQAHFKWFLYLTYPGFKAGLKIQQISE